MELQEGQGGEKRQGGEHRYPETHTGGAWAWDLRRGHILNSSKPELDKVTCEPSEAFE